jgi:hypothetical protein
MTISVIAASDLLTARPRPAHKTISITGCQFDLAEFPLAEAAGAFAFDAVTARRDPGEHLDDLGDRRLRSGGSMSILRRSFSLLSRQNACETPTRQR